MYEINKTQEKIFTGSKLKLIFGQVIHFLLQN